MSFKLLKMRSPGPFEQEKEAMTGTKGISRDAGKIEGQGEPTGANEYLLP